ncbi:B-cadherin isoform X1, partial [Tachysurus ichikawai]
MEIKLDIRLGVLIVLLQVLCGVEATPCSPGFTSDVFVLTVHRSHLQRGTRIGA